MKTEFIVDKYSMTTEHEDGKGEVFGREYWDNGGDYAVTARFPTVRSALDAILRRHAFPVSVVNDVEWTALESISGFGRKVTYYANFTTHADGVTSRFNVRANLLKAVISVPDAADAVNLNHKAE